MREPQAGESRRYHHGDLRRALVDAARRVLEAEGATALSLRAVAREAGVSPAAPYHHFKDKSQLLEAVADEGWEMLNQALGEAKDADEDEAPAHSVRMARLGAAYVGFARRHPELYRVMYDCSRNRDALPSWALQSGGAYSRVREALVEGGVDPTDWIGLELAQVAAWCTAHGLAEMAGFPQFERLKEAMGGEDAFIRGVLDHIGVFAHPAKS